MREVEDGAKAVSNKARFIGFDMLPFPQRMSYKNEEGTEEIRRDQQGYICKIKRYCTIYLGNLG
jgi:hypothetical protein